MVRVQPKTKNQPKVVHAITFDVEEWFHAHNLRIPECEWCDLPSRIERSVGLLLDRLASHGSRATFFVLGWVARRNPDLVRRIHRAGHEIASHGYRHESLLGLTAADFRKDVADSKRILEDIIGKPVIGYRAPRYSITMETIWALDVLQELDFRYDSSIYPVRAPHRKYGISNAPRQPYRLAGGLWEFPLPRIDLLGKHIPAATGAYLRLLPKLMTRACLAQYEEMNAPAILNIHPWELDPDQPRRSASPWLRWVHYTNLRTMQGKLDWLLANYQVAPIHAHLEAWARSKVTMPKSSVLPIALSSAQARSKRAHHLSTSESR